MSRLSSPIEQLQDHYAVVIVGSGYGGAIAAARLARAGRQVAVLERGREWQPGEYPSTEYAVVREMQASITEGADGPDAPNAVDAPLGPGQPEGQDRPERSSRLDNDQTSTRHVGSETGLYEFNLGPHLNVFKGCGLGGTSLVNAGVALRADPRVFSDPRWPLELRRDVDGLLEEGYRRAEAMLKPAPYPDHHVPPPKLVALEKSARFLRVAARRPPINVNFSLDGPNHVGVVQHPCSNCGDCVTGCNYAAKNTLIMNYLPAARAAGAEIFTGIAVRSIERNTSGAGKPGFGVRNSGFEEPGFGIRSSEFEKPGFEIRSSGFGKEELLEKPVASLRVLPSPVPSPQSRVPAFLVHCQLLGLGREKFDAPEITISADLVILAAGALGSTEILLRSRQRGLALSAQVGERLTSNGDMLGFAYASADEVNGVGWGDHRPGEIPPVGPCITGMIDLRDEAALDEGLVIEEGSPPGALARFLPETLALQSGFGVRNSGFGKEESLEKPEFGIRSSGFGKEESLEKPEFGIRSSEFGKEESLEKPEFGIRSSGFGKEEFLEERGLTLSDSDSGSEESSSPNPKSRTPNPGFSKDSSFPNPEPRIPNSGFSKDSSFPNSELRIPNPGFSNPEPRIPSPGSSNPESQTSALPNAIADFFQGPYQGAVRNTQTFLAMGHDDGAGRMMLENDLLRIHWPGVGNQSVFQRIRERLAAAARALKGVLVMNPLWTKLLRHNLLTVHPLGGCVMAERAEQGVVNHKGQVFSGPRGAAVYEDLYICDGAIIPRPLGVNPLLTISALAERCCMLMLEESGLGVRGSGFGIREGRTLRKTCAREESTLSAEPRNSGLGVRDSESGTREGTIRSTETRNPKPETRISLGLAFTETMRGYFSRHSDNFWSGSKLGRLERSPFSFTLTIVTEDLDAMLASPAHQARIIGSVTAPALSPRPLTATEGVFNLFVTDPTSPSTRRMEYRMKLTADDGQQYHFEGFKVIRYGRARYLWHDTTTLYITLRAGAAKAHVQESTDRGYPLRSTDSENAGGADMAASAMSATLVRPNAADIAKNATSAPPTDSENERPVIGKGILKISPADLLRQLSTFEVKNAPHLAERLEAEMRFGRFFAGALYKTYTERPR